ncbi:MAG: PAS domain S-box protein [Thermoleophilia bacterium]
MTRISSSLRLLYVSPSVLRVLGYPIGEVMGARLARFVHRDDLGALREALAALEGGADGVTTVIRIRHRDGRWLWFEIVTHALRDEAGRIIETQASARDVSARRAVEDRNRQFAEELGFVARHAGDMISAHNPDGTFRYVSDASRTLLGRLEDLAGASAAEFLHPDDRERYEAVFARVCSGAATIESITHRVVKPGRIGSVAGHEHRAMRSIEGEPHRLHLRFARRHGATRRRARGEQIAPSAPSSKRSNRPRCGGSPWPSPIRRTHHRCWRWWPKRSPACFVSPGDSSSGSTITGVWCWVRRRRCRGRRETASSPPTGPRSTCCDGAAGRPGRLPRWSLRTARSR